MKQATSCVFCVEEIDHSVCEVDSDYVKALKGLDEALGKVVVSSQKVADVLKSKSPLIEEFISKYKPLCRL